MNQAASSIKALIVSQGLSPLEVYQRFTSMGIKLNDDQKTMVRMYQGEGFVFDDSEPYDLVFDMKVNQNQVDLINSILRSE